MQFSLTSWTCECKNSGAKKVNGACTTRTVTSSTTSSFLKYADQVVRNLNYLGASGV